MIEKDRRRPPAEWVRRDEGQVTAFVAVLLLALLVMLGLVTDGGRALAARVQVTNEAQEAARAGAQALDLAAYRRDGTVRLDPAGAEQRVLAYLSATGDSATAVRVAGDLVSVTVVRVEPTRLLMLAGLGRVHATGTGTARAEPVPPPGGD
jgi:Flp pilus assembly protein TadG